MKKSTFLFSLDLLVGKTEYVSPEELVRSKPYEDDVQKDWDKLNLTRHNGKFVLVDRTTGRIDFTEENYAIDQQSMKDFEEIATQAVLLP
ncbi:MAG TPA: hypothetical protein VIH31_01740 [Candidatus Paceibacterota bacterium]